MEDQYLSVMPYIYSGIASQSRIRYHNPMQKTFDDIQHAITGRITLAHSPDLRTRAAVALILRESESGFEVLFIERARHAGDPWSGDLGFPGGKVETHDADPRFAAERETLEEIGFDLHKTRFLGCLTEITGASMPVRVTCFVYGTSGGAELHLNDEVQDAFWVPLADLLDPERRADVPVHSRGETLPRPAIRLAQPEKPVLWGLTYRLVSEFLTLMS